MARYAIYAALGALAVLSGILAIAYLPAADERGAAILQDDARYENQAPAPDRDAMVYEGRISRIIDGDTLIIDGDHRIRLSIVDTPEKKEPGFDEAKEFLEGLCPPGSSIIYDISNPLPRDRYNRTLAEVWCGGISANAMLVHSGHATAKYCNDSEFVSREWAASC